MGGRAGLSSSRQDGRNPSQFCSRPPEAGCSDKGLWVFKGLVAAMTRESCCNRAQNQWLPTMSMPRCSRYWKCYRQGWGAACHPLNHVGGARGGLGQRAICLGIGRDAAMSPREPTQDRELLAHSVAKKEMFFI